MLMCVCLWWFHIHTFFFRFVCSTCSRLEYIIYSRAFCSVVKETFIAFLILSLAYFFAWTYHRFVLLPIILLILFLSRMNVWQIFSMSMLVVLTFAFFFSDILFSWFQLFTRFVLPFFSRIQIQMPCTFDRKLHWKLNCYVLFLSWFNSHIHSRIPSNKFLLWPVISTGLNILYVICLHLFIFFLWIWHMTPIWTVWRFHLHWFKKNKFSSFYLSHFFRYFWHIYKRIICFSHEKKERLPFS